jgi:signal transduction histidine kinase
MQALDRSQHAGQQIRSLLSDQIDRQRKEHQFSEEESKSLRYGIALSDPSIAKGLTAALSDSPEVLEINVADQTGHILVSSTEQKRPGAELRKLQDFAQWSGKPFIERLTDMTLRHVDWQIVVQFGIQEQSEQIVLVQVVTSSVLLRDQLMPQIRTVSEISGGALLAAILLTLAASHVILLPLKRIELTIDRIAQGNYGGEESRVGAKEFAGVQSKLNLLGQQYKGARESALELRHNVDELLERLASQLDVADRLAAISRLTSGVAHEIKNPLNAISMRLDLLHTRLVSPHEQLSDEEMARELEFISKEVLRLDHVVKTFLDFSRPMEVHFTEVDVVALLGEVAHLMTPPARLAGINVSLDVPSRPVLIRADADMLKQAILNLVTNALEAMKQGGALGLKAVEKGGVAALEVSDTGPGIPPDVRDKVFQLYFTTKTRGSGMGLAMTRRTVELHYGKVEFSSEKGRGTTFFLQFPTVVRHA